MMIGSFSSFEAATQQSTCALTHQIALQGQSRDCGLELNWPEKIDVSLLRRNHIVTDSKLCRFKRNNCFVSMLESHRSRQKHK